jgi:hypothetical protein
MGSAFSASARWRMSPSNSRMNWKIRRAWIEARRSRGVQVGWVGERRSSLAFDSMTEGESVLVRSYKTR